METPPRVAKRDATPSTAAPTTSRRRRGQDKPQDPSTGPTRVEFDPDSPSTTKKSKGKRKKKGGDDEFNDLEFLDGASGQNPLVPPSARAYAQQPTQLTDAYGPGGGGARDDEPLLGEKDASGGGGSRGAGGSNWVSLRNEIRHSKFNGLVVHHHDRLLMATVSLPVVLVTIFFALHVDVFRQDVKREGVPQQTGLILHGASVLRAIAKEQYYAQELQYFHVTPTQQVQLQAETGKAFPFYPHVDTPNYAQAAEQYQNGVAETDEARQLLWKEYLKERREGTAFDLAGSFDESLLEYNRIQVRAGAMSLSDVRYSSLQAKLLNFLARATLHDAIAPPDSQQTVPLRVIGLLGRSVAVHSMAVALGTTLVKSQTATGDNITLFNPLSNWDAFVTDAAAADAHLNNLVGPLAPTSTLTQDVSRVAIGVINEAANSVEETPFSSLTFSNSASTLRQQQYNMLERLYNGMISDATALLSPSEQRKRAVSLESCSIAVLVLVILIFLMHFAMAVSSHKERGKEREIRDLEKAMVRMKEFVLKLSKLDAAVVGSRIPRSAPHQELLLRGFLTPMKDLLSFLPQTIAHPPRCVPDSYRNSDGLWLHGGNPYCSMKSLVAVRIDTTTFHQAFHAAGSKQRAVQHQAQHTLSLLADQTAHYKCTLTVHGDHAICFVNLTQEVLCPNLVALSLAVNIQQQANEASHQMMSISIASGPAFIGYASTQHRSKAVAPLAALNVIGPVTDQLECTTHVSRLHKTKITLGHDIQKGYIHETTHGNAFGWTGGKLYEELEFRPLELIEAVKTAGFDSIDNNTVQEIHQSVDSSGEGYPVDDDEAVMFTVYPVQTLARKRSTVNQQASRRRSSVRGDPSKQVWEGIFRSYMVAGTSATARQECLTAILEYQRLVPADATSARLASQLKRRGEGTELLTAPSQARATSIQELRHAAILGQLFTESA